MTGQPSGPPTAPRRTTTATRRRRPLWILAALIAGATVTATACSSNESADTTTTTAPTTPRPSTTTTPDGAPSGATGDQPLPVAWVTQIGGAGADTVNAAAGRNDTVVGVGSTQGMPPNAPTDPSVTRSLVAVLDASTGAVTSTGEQGAGGSTTARGVASAATTGRTIMCGSTDAATAALGPGNEDGFCAPINPDGAAGTVARSGGDARDGLAGVAITADGSRAYAVGGTDSLFPGAKDPTGGFLGAGDALVLSLDQNGAPGWARQFGTAGSDRAEGVTTSDDGDAIVTGTTDGATDSGSRGGSDGWISRMDPYGNQRWLTQFGSTTDDRALAVGAGGDPRRGTETFVAAGATSGTVQGAAPGVTNAGGDDVMAAAFNASGKQVWASQFGSTGTDAGAGVVLDGSTVYVAGTADAPITGSRRIPLTPTPPDGAGPSSTTTTTSTAPPTTVAGATGRDGFLAALDATTGEVRWVATFGSSGEESVTGLTRTETGLLVLSGTTTGQLGATPPAGGTDGFLLAFRLPSAGGGAADIV